MPVEIVVCYANADREHAVHLERHLFPYVRSGKISVWHRDKVTPGGDAAIDVERHMETAAIVVLLVSADLEIEREDDIRTALRQREARGARVIPVLLRPVDLASVQYSALRMVPDGPPIAQRSPANRDQGWVEVVLGLRRVVDSLQSHGQEQGLAARLASPPLQDKPAAPYGARPTAPQPDLELIKILFLAANPSDRARLGLDQEVREIGRRIQMGLQRSRFQVAQEWAVTISDLSQTLLRHRPTIAHFSGHGNSQGEIILVDGMGNSVGVPSDALASLFRIMGTRGVRCVVLNACYSEPQARAIAEHVDCVVGIFGAITDQAATAFSAGFYTGLAEGETVQVAYELGCLQISLLNYSGAQQPMLILRPGVNPSSMKFVN